MPDTTTKPETQQPGPVTLTVTLERLTIAELQALFQAVVAEVKRRHAAKSDSA